MDRPLLHKIARHIIGNERYRDAVLQKLPSGEAGALEKGPGFIRKHPNGFTCGDGTARITPSAVP